MSPQAAVCLLAKELPEARLEDALAWSSIVTGTACSHPDLTPAERAVMEAIHSLLHRVSYDVGRRRTMPKQSAFSILGQ